MRESGLHAEGFNAIYRSSATVLYLSLIVPLEVPRQALGGYTLC